MAVIMKKKGDPLKGVMGKEEVAKHIVKLQDPDLVFTDRVATRSWLRGTCTVLRTNPKTERAAAFIKSELDKEMRR